MKLDEALERVMNKHTPEELEAFSRGYDTGNYGNAYESEDWDSWNVKRCTASECRSDAYREGLLLGFFSSYEIEEISDDVLAEAVHEYRAKWETDNE